MGARVPRAPRPEGSAVGWLNHSAEPSAQFRVKLPPSIMASVKAISHDSTMPSGQRLAGVLMLIYGFAWYEQQDQVDPTKIALPAEQWREICGLLGQGVPGDKVDAVNLALSFMNQGPSSYGD